MSVFYGDITERKSSQEKLQRSEERFRGVFESSAIGVAILTRGARFLQANRAFCVISGYSEQELRNFDCATLTHPDDRPAIERLLDRLKSGQLPTFVLETRYYRKDGATIWISNSVSLMRDAEGQPENIIALCEDVTVRKNAETALRESEERLRAIFETTPECVRVVAADGTLLQMNSSGLAMVGAASESDVVGQNVYDLIVPEDRERFRQFNELICEGEHGVLEFEITGLGSKRRQMETHAAPLRSKEGRLVQLAVTRDVSQRKRAERASLLLGAIVDSSDEAIVSKDLNGIITTWNKGAERLFGYAAQEAIGQSITIVFPPDRLGEEPEILRRIQRGESVDHMETVRSRKDGTLLDVSLTISPVKDSQGNVIGISNITRDITERKRAEQAIRDLNAQLIADLTAMTRLQQLSTRLVQADDFSLLLTEIVDAGIEITGADMGNIQLFEDGFLKIVAQRGFDTPFLDFFNTVHDGEAACGTALQRRERVIVEDVAKSTVFAGMPARDVMLAAGARAVQSTPLVSRSGHVLGMFSTHYQSPRRPGDRELRMLDLLARQAADLIERKRVETALRESENRFRQLADSMPQMVWTARSDGNPDYFNNRWYDFTGFERNDFGDGSWERILHPEDVKRSYEFWYGAVHSGQPYHIEYRFWGRHEGRFRWFMGRALPVRNESDAIVKWFGTCTDIDEQKRVEDELRRANHDLEQFAYSASHDLQEPLRGIKIYSDVLARNYGNKFDGEALEFLTYVSEGASRMELLMRDLISYTQVSRLDPGDGEEDSNAVLQEALANLDRAVSESGAQITSGFLPNVGVHKTHLMQLFQNMVGNAIKYRSPERPPMIQVSAEQQNGHWLFSIRDNGIGIEPQYRQRIFGLFKRLHTVDEYPGTGNGLAICQRIVERYHGRIWGESEPGQGSTFLFTLPVR